MYRFLLAPRWLALHALLVLVLVAFVWLGGWQLDTFRAGGDDARVLPAGPVALQELAAPGAHLQADALRRAVTVSGEYDGTAQLLVPDRPLAGRNGLHVATPLRLSDGSVVVVDRGWVATPGDPAARVPTGRVTVTGVLAAPEPDAAAARRLPDGQVPALSTTELLIALPYPPHRLYAGHVVLTAQHPSAAPAPTPVPVEARRRTTDGNAWQNLSYAAQWWVFAGAAVFFWASFVRAGVADRRAGGRRSRPLEPAEQMGEPSSGSAQRHSALNPVRHNGTPR